MKLVMMFVAVFAIAAPAFASDGGGSDGCGLGWQVTQKKSFLATTTRATTNGVVPPTFGMTSGTIGCDQHTFAKNEMPAVNMVATNQDAILIDIAAGGGEHLAALGQAMGCRDGASLAQKAQANYSTLAGSSSEQLYRSVKAMALASGCSI
jgi:hypothetical protein